MAGFPVDVILAASPREGVPSKEDNYGIMGRLLYCS